MIKRKYSDGTKGLKAKATVQGVGNALGRSQAASIPPSTDPKNPAFIGPPVGSDTTEEDLDKAVNDSPITSPTPSLPTPSQGTGLAKGGSQYVAALQTKYNAQGANLKVDGAWGPETQKAFEKYQASKTSPTPKKEVVTGLPGGNIAASLPKGIKRKESPIPYSYNPAADELRTSLDKGATSDSAYEQAPGKEVTSNGVKGKVLSDGSVLYPNGRVKTTSGKMDNFSKLPRRKVASTVYPTDQETSQARKTLKAKLTQASQRVG